MIELEKNTQNSAYKELLISVKPLHTKEEDALNLLWFKPKLFPALPRPTLPSLPQCSSLTKVQKKRSVRTANWFYFLFSLAQYQSHFCRST